jgi:hypothetical protein
MHLHVVGPRSYAVVPSKGIPTMRARVVVQSSPSANTGVGTVRAYNPAGLNEAVGDINSFAGDACDWSVPQQLHAQLCGPLDHHSMQDSTAYCQAALLVRKQSIRG